MKKIFNIILCIALILVNYTPLFGVMDVYAAGEYTFAIAYPDDDVEVETGLSYNDALNKMKAYPSTETAVAVVKKGNKVVNARYAYVELDIDADTNERRAGSESNFTLDLSYTANSNWNDGTPSLAPYYGAEGALLDVAPSTNRVKFKIAGLDIWTHEAYTQIVPISKYYTTHNTYFYSNVDPKIYTNESGTTVRKEPKKDSESLGTLKVGSNNLYKYYASKSTTKADDCTWYYIDFNNQKGYVCNENVTEVNTMYSDTYYYVYNGRLYLRIHRGKDWADIDQDCGDAPSYYDENGKHSYLNSSPTRQHNVNSNNRYYSFDGIYFYKLYSAMIDDYKEGVHTRAVNSEHPYYSYFVYLPAHDVSAYSASALNYMVTSNGFTVYPSNPKSYNYDSLPGNYSLLVGRGQDLIDAQNQTGVNAFKILAAAAQESAWGRSTIALHKYNLFGMGASDGDPYNNAFTYSSVKDSMIDYGNTLSSGNYGYLSKPYYFGTHFGDKASGQMVYYASDPYSGYSKANVMASEDNKYGQLQLYSSTLGVTNNPSSRAVKVYKEPTRNSGVIYETKNTYRNQVLIHQPFIVTEKIEKEESGQVNTYYRVYTDFGLNQNRDGKLAVPYDTNYSYGYIRAEDLDVNNNAPILTLSSDNYSADQSTNFDPRTLATVVDYEDDTNKVPVTLSIVGNYDATKVGTYDIAIKATDSSNLSVSKNLRVTIKASKPVISFPENNSVKQYKSFDPMAGVTAVDEEDGDVTSSVVVSGDINTNVMGDYTLTYTAIDSEGNVTATNRIISVIANSKPVISATNTTIYSFDYADKDYDYLKGVTAVDEEDGDVTSSITYTETVNPKVVGTYEVTYTAKDLDNQVSTLVTTVTVEEKKFNKTEGRLSLYSLTFDEDTNLLYMRGYLALKNINATNNYVEYAVVFENQYSGNTIIKPLSRGEAIPKNTPSDSEGFDFDASWFNEGLDMSDVPSGDYTVYIRGRSGDLEAKEVLHNRYQRKDIIGKVKIGDKGIQFAINYRNKNFPLELFVRDEGLLSYTNMSNIDSMFNQINSISLEDNGSLNIVASSHNVNGDYSTNANIIRKLYIENIVTFDRTLIKDVGHLNNLHSNILNTNLYNIQLRVSDGKDKTNAWYETSVDLTSLPVGRYAIYLYTKSGDIEDHGELYDLTYKKFTRTVDVGSKKITLSRNDVRRFRIEITVEGN